MKPEARRIAGSALAAALVVTGAACSDDPVVPDTEVAALAAVVPAPGSLDVDVGTSVHVTFTHPVMPGMGEYAALHEGGVTGPLVDGVWSRSEDGRTLTFSPAAPLEHATTYVIHLGGGMMDDHGNVVDLEERGIGMGGQWATMSMMQGSMGMGPAGQMMGPGWAHPANGSFGMVFTFTTGGP